MSTSNIITTEDVKRFNTSELINFLQTKNLCLQKKEYQIFHKEGVSGHQFLSLSREKLFNKPYKFPGGPTEDLANLINELNKQRLLSQEQALSCIPLPIGYHTNAITLQNTTYSGSQFPVEIRLWDDLFEKVRNFHFDNEPKFKRPQFGDFSNCIVEKDICDAFHYNICRVLNALLPDYEFSRRSVPISGTPDFVCMFGSMEFIMPIEIKREHVLHSETLLIFDETNNHYELNKYVKNVIRQIFTYMTEAQLQYGVLSTYKYHWFLHRPADEPSVLYVSETLPIHSQSPPVLKTYAYIVQVLCASKNSQSP